MQMKLLRSIRDKIQEGNSKNKIFHEIIREYDNVSPEEVAKKLRYIPTFQKKKRFLSLIWAIISLLLLIVSLQAYYHNQSNQGFSGYLIVMVVLSGFLCLGAYSGNAISFGMIGFFGIGHVLTLLTSLTNTFPNQDFLFIVELTATILLVILSFFLRVKFESKYKLPNDEAVLDSPDLMVFDD